MGMPQVTEMRNEADAAAPAAAAAQAHGRCKSLEGGAQKIVPL
jgi:hypothetical protein